MVSERIKQIRNDLKLTLVQFGERIGLNNSTLSMIERGQRSVTDRTIKLICSEYKVSENWLRTGDGDMYQVDDDEKQLIEELADMLKNDNEELREFILSTLELDIDEIRALNALIRVMNAKKNNQI